MNHNELTILNLNTYIEFLQAQVAERNELINDQAQTLEFQREVIDEQHELIEMYRARFADATPTEVWELGG